MPPKTKAFRVPVRRIACLAPCRQSAQNLRGHRCLLASALPLSHLKTVVIRCCTLATTSISTLPNAISLARIPRLWLQQTYSSLACPNRIDICPEHLQRWLCINARRNITRYTPFTCAHPGSMPLSLSCVHTTTKQQRQYNPYQPFDHPHPKHKRDRMLL